ncbi:EcsC family protein [Nostoc sp. UCD121]|uniref:EcsC family protein n=1 Tax=unclassified Nostoc TaxID=2593658 RepID=UPI001623DDF7|nr:MULTISPECIES: EcsC family protein [unclassified Nostoc]MBC1219342.1 EcsC family protein [Nostoc sp. UCD120]MBC1280833.1 EcsC family protein [Nostoc sp. UCD121]MBC1298907.1 EcsC family protein [Nostoc sp. UCD122]
MADKSQQEIVVNKSVNSPNETSEIKIQAQSSVENEPSVLESFVQSVAQTGKAVLDTALEVGEATAKQTHKLIEQTTQTSGEVVNRLSENWLIRKLSGVLNLNWLIGTTDAVDLEKAEAAVNKLKQKYPNESPSEIAHRIMVEKATQAGTVGLATSILPGVAIALLAIDLTATTKLQSEMLYQIAFDYGLDLKDPARKGEVLAIFGLALGGGRLLKAAGLGLLRNVPLAGAAIAASSNATMIYSLGYAACRFYEAKLDESTSLASPQTLETLKAESEKYLESAIAQEAVMDQILVHMILASHPDKTLEEILPELQAVKLSPTSLDAIAQNIKSPKSLDILLNQLNRDFAIPLLVQCQKIAQLDNKTTPLEQEVIAAIARKFDIDKN